MRDLLNIKEMERKTRAKLCFTVLLLSAPLVVFVLWMLTTCNGFYPPVIRLGNQVKLTPEFEGNFTGEDIHVAMALCGKDESRLNEIKVLLKSCVLFTSHHVQAHLFVQDWMKAELVEYLNSWPDFARRKLTLNLYELYFPIEGWKDIWRPCASQRLFMHYKLPASVQQLIYIDSDSLVLAPLEDVWMQFDWFGPKAQLGMALETVTHEGWYDWHLVPMHKQYPHGFNSGVMLMNITRIRSDSDWLTNMIQIKSNQSELRHKRGDQDILNQYVAMFPDRVFKLPCYMNYRSDFCFQSTIHFKGDVQTCPGADETGVYILHGNRDIFHKRNYGNYVIFRHTFNVFTQYRFEDGILRSLVPALEKMALIPSGLCNRLHNILFKRVKEYAKCCEIFPT